MTLFDAEAKLKPATGARRLLSLALLGLLGALPGAAFAANTLHLTGTHRSATEHDYEFAGHYDTVGQYSGAAERVHLAIEGKYVNRRATETLTIFGPTGQATFSGTWSCAKDPWLNPSVSCIAVTPQASVGNPPYEEQDFFVSLCNAYPDGYCFLSRKLVPADVAQWMRDGPPAPSVSGVSFTHHPPVNVALHYVPDLAEHFYVDEWYCPPGKNAAPGDIPNGEPTPTPGEACQNSVRGPLALNKGASSAIFGIGKPAGQPANGTWYVRASLASASYGRSLWGHWHKTGVQLPMHFKDAPNNKPAPEILAPAEGDVISAENPPLDIKLKTSVAGIPEPTIEGKYADTWSYDIQWQRQRYITKANAKIYNELHKGGFPSQLGATEAMHTWATGNGYKAQSNPATIKYVEADNYEEMRPRSEEFSYRYRIRARVNNSNWSAWRYFIVTEPTVSSYGNRRGVSVPDALPTKAPEILTPTENQLFAYPQGTINKYVNINIQPNVPNAKPDHWQLQLEWRRAKYRTKANNAMYECKYGPPAKGGFPRQTGALSAPQLWDVMATPTMGNLNPYGTVWEPFFSTFAPDSTLFSYQYEFRARAQRVSPEAYGPWSPWRSFIVENTGFNKCAAVKTRANPGLGGIGIHVSGQTQKQSGQQSGQHSRQRAAPAMRIGSRARPGLALHQQGPAMHTTSGSLHPSRGRRAPQLKVVDHSASVDSSCTNLAGFITISETVRNDGAPLPAGHAKLYVRSERGGAYLGGRAVPVPALAHGEQTTLVLKAGTREAYRRRIPGRHVLPIVLDLNGRAITITNVAETLGRRVCQPLRRAPHPASARIGVKLNPQPEPPAPRPTLAIPHR